MKFFLPLFPCIFFGFVFLFNSKLREFLQRSCNHAKLYKTITRSPISSAVTASRGVNFSAAVVLLFENNLEGQTKNHFQAVVNCTRITPLLLNGTVKDLSFSDNKTSNCELQIDGMLYYLISVPWSINLNEQHARDWTLEYIEIARYAPLTTSIIYFRHTQHQELDAQVRYDITT